MTCPFPIIYRFAASHRAAICQTGSLALMLLMIVLPLSHMLALRSFSFGLLIACAALLVFSSPSHGAGKPPLFWVFSLWLGAALLSLQGASDTLPALENIWKEIIKSALVFYAAYLFIKASADENACVLPALISLFILSGGVVISWALHGTWKSIGPIPALGDYNTSAITLLPLAALPIYAHWRQRLGHFATFICIVTIALTLIGAVLSQSRSFWLVVAVMLVTAKLAWDCKRGFCWDRSVAITAGILGVIALIAYAVAQWRGLDLLFFDTRSNIYLPVLKRLGESPITGFGFGHESSQAWYQTHMIEAGVFHAHNILLSYTEQMGILGLAAVLAIFGSLGHRFFRHVASPNPFHASIAGIGLAMIAGVFVKNNLDFFFSRHNLLLFFLCSGLLLGILEANNNAHQQAQKTT